jgi:hypothetical protein
VLHNDSFLCLNRQLQRFLVASLSRFSSSMALGYRNIRNRSHGRPSEYLRLLFDEIFHVVWTCLWHPICKCDAQHWTTLVVARDSWSSLSMSLANAAKRLAQSFIHTMSVIFIIPQHGEVTRSDQTKMARQHRRRRRGSGGHTLHSTRRGPVRVGNRREMHAQHYSLG